MISNLITSFPGLLGLLHKCLAKGIAEFISKLSLVTMSWFEETLVPKPPEGTGV